MQEVVSSMDVDPLTEKTDFETLRDNRDCKVMQSWDPADRLVARVMSVLVANTTSGLINWQLGLHHTRISELTVLSYLNHYLNYLLILNSHGIA